MFFFSLAREDFAASFLFCEIVCARTANPHTHTTTPTLHHAMSRSGNRDSGMCRIYLLPSVVFNAWFTDLLIPIKDDRHEYVQVQSCSFGGILISAVLNLLLMYVKVPFFLCSPVSSFTGQCFCFLFGHRLLSWIHKKKVGYTQVHRPCAVSHNTLLP